MVWVPKPAGWMGNVGTKASPRVSADDLKDRMPYYEYVRFDKSHHPLWCLRLPHLQLPRRWPGAGDWITDPPVAFLRSSDLRPPPPKVIRPGHFTRGRLSSH